MKLRKFCSAVLCGALVLSCGTLAGCKKTDYKPYSVVIYEEYNGTVGSHDDEVKAEIERKFKADTGLDLDLMVETASTDFVGQKIVTAISTESSRIDAFVTHYGSDAPINSYIIDGSVKDLTQTVKEKAPNYWNRFHKSDEGVKALNSGKYDNKLYAMSELTRSSGWGAPIDVDKRGQDGYIQFYASHDDSVPNLDLYAWKANISNMFIEMKEGGGTGVENTEQGGCGKGCGGVLTASTVTSLAAITFLGMGAAYCVLAVNMSGKRGSARKMKKEMNKLEK